MPRILLLPYDVLSSVGRQLALGDAFRAAGWDVSYAGSGPYLDLIERQGFDVRPLGNLSASNLLQRIRPMERSWSRVVTGSVGLLHELDPGRWIDEEVGLFRELSPDVVLSEERLTAAASARICGLPHVSLRNAYRTPFTAYPVSALPEKVPRFLAPDPVRFEQRILSLLSLAFLPRLNRSLKRHGSSLRFRPQTYLLADDLVLMCDVREFAPVKNAPPNFRYLGPIVWTPDISDPPWLDRLASSRGSAVYVSLGSTATSELYRWLIESVTTLDRPVVISTGGQFDGILPEAGQGVFASDFIRADSVLEYCGLVICHGGNGTVYQALAHEKPVLAFPTHMDQRFNAKRLEDLGLGSHWSPEEIRARPSDFRQDVERLIGDRGIAERVRHFRALIASYDAPSAAVHEVSTLLGRLRCG